MDLIRAFNAELVYIRSPFPMGKKGLMLKDGKLSPAGGELEQMIAMWGPAAKPGDQARISGIIIKDKSIHFEINGGPVKKQKWYQRIQVGGSGGMTSVAPSDPNANPRMNREMVTTSKGRPPKKTREKDGETEYEEWIYGDPPQDVDFVRFVADEVVRVETMKVDGEKLVRTEKEVNIESPTVAKTSSEPAVRPPGAPSLRRPGEEPDPTSPGSKPASGPAPMPRPTSPDPGSQSPVPN